MKVIDNGNSTTIELETEAGQQNFRASLKADIAGDRRTWSREAECIELNKFMQDNGKSTQVVVKVGDSYTKIR